MSITNGLYDKIIIERPVPPPIRLIMENSVSGICSTCGSSLQRKFKWLGHLFGISKVLGCVQPQCSNYYGELKGDYKK